jgi:hypothetical protein
MMPGDYVQLVFRVMEQELDFSSTLSDAIAIAKRKHTVLFFFHIPFLRYI